MDRTNCMEVCLAAQRACTETMAWCLREGGDYAEATLIRTLLDCAQISQAVTDFLARGSPLYPVICLACTAIATRCAEECERLARTAPCLEQCA